MKGKTTTLLIVFISILITAIYLIKPALSDDHGTNVTLTLVNSAPVVYSLDVISPVEPTENTVTAVSFSCSVNDPDGYGDITSVSAVFYKDGETNKTSSCTASDIVNDTTRAYACSIDMQFYDTPGDWNYKCTATDSDSLSSTNTSTFTYNELTAYTMDKHSISFGMVHMGDTGIESVDNPITLANTGNEGINLGVNALDLVGVTNSSDYMPAEDFQVEGNYLANDTVTDTGTSLDVGPSSTQQLNFQIDHVPTGLSYQVYNTAALGEWTISALT